MYGSTRIFFIVFDKPLIIVITCTLPQKTKTKKTTKNKEQKTTTIKTMFLECQIWAGPTLTKLSLTCLTYGRVYLHTIHALVRRRNKRRLIRICTNCHNVIHFKPYNLI